MALVSFLFALFLPLASFAWETDNVACASASPKDVTAEVNTETNRRIADALKKQNTRVPSLEGFDDTASPQPEYPKPVPPCDRENITNLLRNELANPWMGSLEDWIKESTLDRCDPSGKKTVFDGFSFTDSPMVKAAGLDPVYQINGVHVSADKLSHFMTEGFQYNQEYQQSGSLKNILDIGTREEEGGYGWAATGVKSYGDMSADYHGFLFWKDLFDGDRPYLKCENGQWVQQRPFDWREFIDSSFDESINCNEYKTASMNQKADKAATEILTAQHFKGSMTCPLYPEACVHLAKAYDPIVASAILHPRCLKKDPAQAADAAANAVPAKEIYDTKGLE